jgi:phosphoesterase RecJ-like protein
VESDCNSTTEILYQLLPQLGATINTDLATSLLTGVVTDTLGFRTVGVTPNTFAVAGELMQAGADLTVVTTQALLIKPLSTLRLWQVGLDNMKLEEEGLLWTSISQEERRKIGHIGSSSGGLVNMMANVDEVAISAVLLEDDSRVYVGFRCRPPYSVSELALNLGGGGHPLASGCTLEGPLREVESLVVSMTKEAIRQQRALLASD